MLSHFVNRFRSGYIFQNKPPVLLGDIRNVSLVCTWSPETIRKAEVTWFTCYKLILLVYEHDDQLSASNETKHVYLCGCSAPEVFVFVSGEMGAHPILQLNVKSPRLGLKSRPLVRCLSALEVDDISDARGSNEVSLFSHFSRFFQIMLRGWRIRVSGF